MLICSVLEEKQSTWKYEPAKINVIENNVFALEKKYTVEFNVFTRGIAACRFEKFLKKTPQQCIKPRL